MSSGVDAAVAAAELKRRLRRWRVGAVVLFGVAVAAVSAGSRQSGIWNHNSLMRPHLVKIRVNGVIGPDVSRWTKALAKAEKEVAVKGLILDIDSPGGSVTGGEELHDAIEHFSKLKPVVATMSGVGASAGYMIALPARRIYAERSTLTGSIGVIMESPDFSGLLGKIGVNVDELVSGPLKGQPSLVKPISPEGRIMLQGVVSNLFDQFVAMVVSGRHMPEEKVRSLADGRPYTGQQALSLGLIDALGSRDDAVDWLGKVSDLKGEPCVEAIGEAAQRFSFRRRLAGLFGGALMSWLGHDFAEILPQDPIRLDGAVSIWKP
ncbi:signal peptide peptidase SppA [Acetobacter oeni]|uniref:Clp protease n=1 Tax=Acetobacter oeni TaxID=304077 RepID=A0A511XG44_9PROT|nr:signal peptide peptidase SppA [Acetobacter oeni]MBB3882160.1 protease-4 [Acetobacter oeni]NHO17919.1 signal peptide peptidase SppA [Acetobacter oeni]GBR01488.1 signal peptide peptidase sppA [Acetobacter oeni LMG 21952]GEN61920.1 Clp protease [Acetobacter oeni]